MSTRDVSIQFANGLDSVSFVRDILWMVSDQYRVVSSGVPRILIFGPYGPRVPQGPYIRVGYYCENIRPDLEACDWAFGVPYETEIMHDKYMRIEWHAIQPVMLRRLPVCTPDASRRQFANFVYYQHHAHRERLFSAVSAYRPVDAPGRSMNNMPSFDGQTPGGDVWERKRHFLSGYKFTLAVENAFSPGYNTEKLTDPLLAGSLPVYWGNPFVSQHFNQACFVNVWDYLPPRSRWFAEHFDGILRDVFAGGSRVPDRIVRRVRRDLRALKARLAEASFKPLLRRIAELDKDETKYMDMLLAPRLSSDADASVDRLRARWRKILDLGVS